MLFHLMWIPAALTTLGVFAVWDAISKWWIVPILLGAFVFWNLVYLAYVFIICKRVDMTREYPTIDPFYHKNMMLFIDWLLTACGVTYTLEGREWLPEEGEFLLVSNHRSAFDPLVTLMALRDVPLAFISKPENITKLFLGAAAWRCCFLPIDRENARNALKTINEAAERMKNHACSFAIYPEGTRTRDGDLHEFHPGSFKTAQKARVPVVVMATEGSETALRGLFFKRNTVRLTILETIDAETVKEYKTVWLAERSHDLILELTGH